MWAFTISGISGALTPQNVTDADELAKTLLYAEYTVKCNALRIRLEYGPGYDTVVWDEGDLSGSPQFESVIPA